MANGDSIPIPRSPSPGIESYANYVHGALQACYDAGRAPLFMPELARARAESVDGPLWNRRFVAPSLRATGRPTGSSAAMVVYAHEAHYLSNPANIRAAIDGKHLINGAAPLPQDEFDRLYALVGNGRVFAIPHATLHASSSDVIPVSRALQHPQTIPFLGIGEEGARSYLQRHTAVYGDKIGVWHSNDLSNDSPMGRVLFLGDNVSIGLSGDYYFNNGGRVVGVAPEALVALGAPASAPLSRTVAPERRETQMLDEGMLAYLRDHPDVARLYAEQNPAFRVEIAAQELLGNPRGLLNRMSDPRAVQGLEQMIAERKAQLERQGTPASAAPAATANGKAQQPAQETQGTSDRFKLIELD